MNYQAWLQILLAAVGTANPQIAALVAMITNGIQSATTAVQEERQLEAYWIAFCQKIVDENRDPTPEEHQAALAFANSVHAANQAG